jgi:hypothetical protein
VLRIRLSGESVEWLTFTGPFLAEPAKGWLLKRRGVSTPAAFAAVVTEYLLYTATSSCLGILIAAFITAFIFASLSGIGVIVPILRRSRLVLGRRGGDRARSVAVVFAFIPGQIGASESVYALLVSAIGLSAAAGVSLALVRRLRGLTVAALGLILLTFRSR